MATALITGGTSGIGLAFARELAGRGTDLVLVARDAQRLGEVAGELESAHGVTIETFPADLSDRADMQRVAKRLESDDSPIDMLINNAGFGLHSTVLDPEDIDTHAKALDVMCLALLVLGGAAGRTMRERGRGQIINVASSSSAIFSGNYSAIKAWARTYSTGLALELQGSGVTVTALLPGWVRTEFHERAGITATNLPDIVWIEPDVLVRECLDDVDKGKLESVPTLKWKAAMLLADHGPKWFVRWFSVKLTNSRKNR